MAFTKLASMNAFENVREPNSNKPRWSNGKVRIEQDIPAGEHQVAVWENERGLSISISRKDDDYGMASGNQPANSGGVDDPANW